jgi:DNA-binding PadR family transcriptional regulator
MTTLSSRTAQDLLPLRPVVFHVLLSLADSERHGYAIVQDIAERSAARIRLEPGNLYRHLKFMLDEGLIEESGRRPVAGRDDERRRYYRMTRFGRQVALAEASRLEAVAAEARARLVARSQARS